MSKKKPGSVPKPDVKTKTLSIKHTPLSEIKYPIFCFKYLQDNSLKDCSDPNILKKLIFRLRDLSQLGWNEIGTSQRHGYGGEPIPCDNIKPQLPAFITPDVQRLYAYRFTGDNRPFLALRNDTILHIIYIETDFGDIYKH